MGCSRTLPVASSWNGQDSVNNSGVSLVKREPLASVPCQVAEVSTSLHATTTSVKIEPMPPKSENGNAPISSVERKKSIVLGAPKSRRSLANAPNANYDHYLEFRRLSTIDLTDAIANYLLIYPSKVYPSRKGLYRLHRAIVRS